MKRGERDLSLRNLAVALGLGALALIVYVRTLAPTVLPGDSGEFQFAAPLLGLAHPTGYPLYLLLGKLWTLLVPWGDMAFRMNLLSAVLSAAAVGVVYLLARRLGLGPGAAVAAALVLAFSTTFWSQAVRAEVYALNTLLVALLLLVSDRGRERVRGYTPVLPALLFGLGLAHHRTVLLLVPALLVLLAGAWGGRRPGGSRGWRLVVCCLLLPLLLYLYIPLRQGATPYARLAVGGGPELVVFGNTLRDYLALVSGSVFRGSLGLAAGAGVEARLTLAADLVLQQVGPLGLVLATLGLVYLLLVRPRRGVALLLAFAATVGFCLVYFIGDIADLFTPAYLVLALWVGAGAHGLAALAFERRSLPFAVAALLVAMALPVWLFVGNRASVDLSGQRQTRAAWQALLSEPLPQGAVLVSNDRDEMTPMWYLQYVEGVRPDLVGLFPQITPAADFADIGTLLDWLLARGEQPYLIKVMPGLDVKYALQPVGRLVQVTGRIAPDSWPAGQRLAADFAGLLGLLGAVAPARAAPGASFDVVIYWQPLSSMTENYHTFVHVVDGRGERVAGSDHRPGGDFYPTSMWAPGDVLADRHTLVLPAALPAGTYQVRVGVYRYPALSRLAVTGSAETMALAATLEVR